jgi:DNA-binding CsgD family transcriptional regulator
MVEGEPLDDSPQRGKSPRPGSTAAHLDFNLLTDREREIFRLLAQSRTYKDIGSIFGISPRTVEAHRSNIKAKLGVTSQTELKHFSQAFLAWESAGIDHLV